MSTYHMIYKVMVSNLMVSWFANLDDGIFCWSHRFSHPPWIGEAVKHVGCEDQNFYKKGIASDSTQSDGSGHAAGQASQARILIGRVLHFTRASTVLQWWALTT